MATDGELARDGVPAAAFLSRGDLAAFAEEARLRADRLRAAAIRIAEQVEAAEYAASALFAQMADQRERDVGRLRAKSQAALQRAERERQWIEKHRDPGGVGRLRSVPDPEGGARKESGACG